MKNYPIKKRYLCILEIRWKKLKIKFMNSEKATKVCEISTLILTVCTAVKSKVEISQNFVAFSEFMNFNSIFPLSSKQEVAQIITNLTKSKLFHIF